MICYAGMNARAYACKQHLCQSTISCVDFAYFCVLLQYRSYLLGSYLLSADMNEALAPTDVLKLWMCGLLLFM